MVDRCAAVCAMRRAPHEGQNPRRLQLKATSLSCPFVVPAVGAMQAQEAMRQNSAFEVRVELVTDELRQASASGRLSLSEEALGVLLHPAVQRSLLTSVAPVVDRGAIAPRSVSASICSCDFISRATRPAFQRTCTTRQLG
ncbi:MAG: hypothetical protein ABIN37_00865 [Burkholderiaceae bacterium]